MSQKTYFLFKSDKSDMTQKLWAVWQGRDEAIQALNSMRSLTYFDLYEGSWTSGKVPATQSLVRIKFDNFNLSMGVKYYNSL